MKKQILSEEFRRMQKLAGIITNKHLNEETKIDTQGNFIYSLYDENSDWDFSDSETFMITWTLDKDVSNIRVQRKFEWDDEDFNIKIPIKDIQAFLKDPTRSTENFKVFGGYIPITKQEANDILDSYYENWPDEINPNLN